MSPWWESTLREIIRNTWNIYFLNLISSSRNEEQGSIVLSFRELSTGAPHPLAKHPDIVVDPVHGHEGKLSVMMEIVGPRLLLLLAWSRTMPGGGLIQHQTKLLLFNWWEGRKVAVRALHLYIFLF